jgi:perosamine synthetase
VARGRDAPHADPEGVSLSSRLEFAAVKPIPHSKPWITDADQGAVASALASGMIVQGERTRDLERAVAAWHGLADEGSVAVASGGAAVLLALLALGAGPGDEVVLPSYVCQSVLEAVASSGARPVVCDVGEGWVVTPADVARHLGPRTRALVVPHMYGIFADVAAFRRFGLPIVEDCAQAVGGRGSRPEGDIAVFSFHATKCLTTGEGGLALAREPRLAAELRRLRDGDTVAPRQRVFAPLPDPSAALGLSQLARYAEALARRRELWARYRERLEAVLPGCCAAYPVERSMFFRFVIRVRGGVDAYEAAFLARGVNVRRGVDRLNHRLLGLGDHDFPVSVRLFETTLSLPLYPALTDDEHRWCADAAAAALAKAALD